jgi:hypothetical protein
MIHSKCTVLLWLQILHFILNHSEMVTMVLRAGSPYMQLGHLKELARLTGVIARSSYQGQQCLWPLQTALTNFPSLLSATPACVLYILNEMSCQKIRLCILQDDLHT